uniref:Casein kinase II subunit beta n=1 Tax=Rhabditophanes sp. KR3021 TaxID=114890 RepID=A0AC35TID5_9BILA
MGCYIMDNDLLSSSDEEMMLPFCHRHYRDSKNVFMTEVPKEFLNDSFNLTGIADIVGHSNLKAALRIIGQNYMDEGNPEFTRLHKTTTIVLGLAHARYILTKEGMTKMFKKFAKQSFGRCIKVSCNQAFLPIGISDILGQETMKLYCLTCQDVYEPELVCNEDKKHLYEKGLCDGAFFGTSFPQMLLMHYDEFKETELNSESSSD